MSTGSATAELARTMSFQLFALQVTTQATSRSIACSRTCDSGTYFDPPLLYYCTAYYRLPPYLYECCMNEGGIYRTRYTHLPHLRVSVTGPSVGKKYGVRNRFEGTRHRSVSRLHARYILLYISIPSSTWHRSTYCQSYLPTTALCEVCL